MKSGQHIVSLSLGTMAEPSAVVVIDPRTEFGRREKQTKKRDSENHFDVTHIERFPAGRPIPTIVARVSELVSDERLAKNCHLLLDITSTGAAPLRVFEGCGLYPTAIEIMKAGSEEYSDEVRRVPLRDVIGAAQVVQQTNRLKAARALNRASTLVGDLLSFDPKPVARNMDLRGGRNSDIVLALAVALWWGDNLTWGDDGFDISPLRRRSGQRSSGKNSWMGT